MATIGKRVRSVALARLAAAWVSKLTAAAGSYGLPAKDLDRLTGIDWAQSRTQVFCGDIDVEDLDESVSFTEPAVALFCPSSNFEGNTKFMEFSGSVELVIRFFYEWSDVGPLGNFEDVPDLIEETVYKVFHDPVWCSAPGAGLSYRGEASVNKGPVQRAGENWRRVIEARLRFGLDV